MESQNEETHRDSRESSARQPRRWRVRAHRIFTAAVQAAFVTLLTVIAYDLGILAPVDTELFARTTAFFNDSEQRSTDSAVVVEIDQRYFEEQFEGRTPLDRDELGKLIGMLAELGRALVVDLDLSPRGETLERFAASGLTCDSETLESWPIEKALCAATEPVVLPVPFPASLDDAKIKYEWMRFVCGTEHATFAFSDIPAPQGPYTVDYFDGTMTLVGAVRGAKHAVDAPGTEKARMAPATEQAGEGAGAKEDVLCAALTKDAPVGGLPIDFAFLSRGGAELPPERSPLRYEHLLGQKRTLLNFRRSPVRVALSSCEDRCKQEVAASALSNATLFLGGTWASNGADEFLTPLGVLPGVLVHAYATNASVKKVTKARALLIEFGVGFVLVVLFRAIWERADHALETVIHAGRGAEPRRPLRGLARYVSFLLMIPLAVTLVALAILLVTAYAFSAYVWMAPAALLLGVLVKSYLEREPHVLAPGSPYWHSALVHLPQILISAVAVMLLIEYFYGETT